MAEWKDITNYSQSQRRHEVEPRTWELVDGMIGLIVTRCHGLDGWWGRCYSVRIKDIDLGDVDLIEAQSHMVTAYEQAVLKLISARGVFQIVRRDSIRKREGWDDGD